MDVILLTVFVGLVLVSLFVVLFLHSNRQSPGGSDERNALMPLQEEESKPHKPSSK